MDPNNARLINLLCRLPPKFRMLASVDCAGRCTDKPGLFYDVDYRKRWEENFDKAWVEIKKAHSGKAMDLSGIRWEIGEALRVAVTSEEHPEAAIRVTELFIQAYTANCCERTVAEEQGWRYIYSIIGPKYRDHMGDVVFSLGRGPYPFCPWNQVGCDPLIEERVCEVWAHCSYRKTLPWSRFPPGWGLDTGCLGGCG